MSADELRETRHWKVQKKDGSKLEPANLDVLRQWVSSGQIEPDDLVINDEIADWIPASEVLELFDLFEKPGKKPETPAAPEVILVKESEKKIEIPGCAFHSDRESTAICVGCGKFICEECGDRLEGKMYCRGCRAEKQVGAEPGAPPGMGPVAQIIPGVAKPLSVSRLALASLVLAIISIISLVFVILPKFNITIALLAAFIAFVAILLGRAAINRIRLNRESDKGRPFALAGVISGAAVLLFSLAAVLIFTLRFQPARRAGQVSGLQQPMPSRRQGAVGSPARPQTQQPMTAEMLEEREANAQQLLEEVQRYMAEGQLEQAVSTSKTILGLYPETETAKLLRERLPTLEEALGRLEVEKQELSLQNEQLAQQRLEHALRMYSEGNRRTALDLFKSIVESYPETKIAVQARAEVEKIEKVIANQELMALEDAASELALQAEQRMESEQYEEAARLYRQIGDQYPRTLTADSVRSRLEEAELLAGDPSERDFRRLTRELDQKTYEESIALVRDFMTRYPSSDRIEEAGALLEENQTNKNIADSLYNFGQTYFGEQKYGLAAGRYQKLIDEYPRSRWLPQARTEYKQAVERSKQ